MHIFIMIMKGIMTHDDDHDFDATPTRRGRRKADPDKENKATKSEERC